MLDLRFSTRAGRVEVACDDSYAGELTKLKGRFATAASLGSRSFDLELDDLLVNLRELAAWPVDDGDVRWQPELLALVEGNARDADTVGGRISGAIGTADSRLVSVPTDWTAPLTDFQLRDITKLLSLGHGANFSVPGAGKTRVTLAVFSARRAADEVERMLVVCPKSAYESWQTESQLCFPAPSFRVSVMEGTVPPECDILLVNYERLPDLREALLRWLRARPALLVLDEAHRTKRGPQGVWGTVCLSLGAYATRRMILSGTPAPNGAKDLENLLAFVWPGQGRAAVAGALTGSDLATASQVLRPLFVRTTKVELDLPPVDLKVHRVTLPPLHREIYDALIGQAAARWMSGARDVESLGRVLLYLLMAATTPALLATGATRYEPLPYRVPPLDPPPGSTLSSLMRDLPNYEFAPKYQETLSIVAANSAVGRKTIVWSTFVRNLTSLAHLLDRFSPAVVHGGTIDRQDQLRRFREDPACTVLLSNPSTLGEGVSLHQVCHDAVYVDRDFAAGRFLQSLDRIHRLGLAPDVVTRITVLIADQTIDDLVDARLALKLKFMGGILDDPSVLELADLDEEPSESAGMDTDDVAALIGYLNRRASA